MEQFTTVVALIGVVIVVASLLSNVLEKSGVPLAAAFLVLGAALGPAGLGLIDIGLHSPVLRVLATLGLALVLFSDAVTTELADIRKNRRMVVLLLGPGTLLPAVVMGIAGWLLLDVTPPAAALLGAALASTDAILLRPLLHAKSLPPAAQVALRLETGMNDIVLLPIVLVAMMLFEGGQAVTGSRLAQSALTLLVVGPVIGAAVGWLGVIALTRVRLRSGVRRDYEALYALALAFIAFAAAEAAGGSGFVAAFAAGLTIGAADVELCDCFHEYGEATSLMLLLLTFVAFGASLIWTGLSILNGRTLLFAAVALSARTAILLPLLAKAVPSRERRLIALLGPRGISSLLLALLPVFAGLQGAEEVFTVTCLVVLLSIVVHGTGMGFLLRAQAPTDAPAATRSVSAPVVPERVSLEELTQLREAGTSVVIADTRTERGYRASANRAEGAVRIPPAAPVEAATGLGLPRDATIALYCA